jgi:mannosylglycerate hydrolase MGH1-like protein
MTDIEKIRLEQADAEGVPWRKWGPYLSERQWGTVREDYSQAGDAWNFLSHEASRSRVYRWGEDGLAGISDDQQQLCFALALWNGKDAILKERAFGLTNSEGNHGEDVKEYYFYLDNTPTHSYMKYLYKYPQRAFPYRDLVENNQRRNRKDFEYELLDSGVFDDDRYFDVFVEYAKASPEDILIEITVANRGADAALLHVLPTLWFRNTWSPPFQQTGERPELRPAVESPSISVIAAHHSELGDRYLYAKQAELLFCDNESNVFKHPSERPSTNYYKDGIHEYIVNGNREALNPARSGTKASLSHIVEVPARGEVKLQLRLCPTPPDQQTAQANGRGPLGADFQRILGERRAEADAFYEGITPRSFGPHERQVFRQALAGMLWTKQFYAYDVALWMRQHGVDPLATSGPTVSRNGDWQHMVQTDIISMPDKWEYPWYAAWDLAFHVLPLSLVDPKFGKDQLQLLMRERYLHPNGQLPAYEWNFGDVNPPVHAWSTYFLYQQDRQLHGGAADMDFLRSSYNKLLLNFTWWVNRKDPTGRNVFEGGFLGLDNIGVFDRSAPLPFGGRIEQADGTAWMAFFAQSMLQLSLELAVDDRSYADMALKFFEHFMWIASALGRVGGDGMWDEEDGFFYDVVRAPDGRAARVKVRSMVGLLPICASTVLDESIGHNFPELAARARSFVERRPEIIGNIHDPRRPGVHQRHLLSIVDEPKLRRVLSRMLDPEEFFSPYGIRSLSRYHHEHPYSVHVAGTELGVGYLPAESDSGMFGGNSNWRGPVWVPVNGLLVRSLVNLYAYYGDEFRVECPTRSGNFLTLYEVAREITNRLVRMYLRDEQGHRPVYGLTKKFADDPNWRDHLLFYEYFHGDNGAGLGASHQTGWTGLIASLMHFFANNSAESVLAPRTRQPRTRQAATPPLHAPAK